MNKTGTLFENLQRLGLSIYQFSKETGIPKGRIYAWKDGKGKPKADDAKIIATYFATKGLVQQNEGQEVEPNAIRETSGITAARIEVLMTSMAELLSATSGENVTVVKRRLEKAAEELAKMG